jgi:methylmalonyl-CoA mutase N-terminal domain/subunit
VTPEESHQRYRYLFGQGGTRGGVQSVFTAAWDEPFALPSEESAMLALGTQQILAYANRPGRPGRPQLS